MNKNYLLTVFCCLFAMCSCTSKELKDSTNEIIEITEDDIASILTLKSISKQKEEISEKIVTTKAGDLTEVEYPLDDTGGLVIVEWNGNGHGKYCRGWGLCQARWFPGTYEVHDDDLSGSILKYDPKDDKYYMDIELEKPAPESLDKNLFDFTIEEKIAINSTEAIGKELYLEAGIYKLEENIGDAGGYRVYLSE